MRLKNVFGWWARQSLVLRIFIGLVVGAVLGLFVPEAAFISVLGKLFVGALKAIAPILVFVLIAASVSNVKGRRLSGISNDIAMQVVAVGFVIGVIQDSVETALNSSSDALFIIATDMNEKRKINSEK